MEFETVEQPLAEAAVVRSESEPAFEIIESAAEKPVESAEEPKEAQQPAPAPSWSSPIGIDAEVLEVGPSPEERIENVEKSIEEIKARIDQLAQSIESVGAAIKAVSEKADALSKIVETVALWKCSRCKFFAAGVCKAWRISEEFADTVKKVFGEDSVVVEEGVARIRVDKAPIIGAICSLFKPKI